MVTFNHVTRRSAAFLPILLLQGCVTPGTDLHLKKAAVVLEQRSDADSLAAAGLLNSSERKPHLAVDLLTRATAIAPERADLAWLQIQICRNNPACDPEQKAARLRTLVPSNGAAWLNALTQANAADDEAERITVLSALARTERVDLYWTTLIVHLTRAVADTKEVPLREALVEVIGVLAAQAIPAYSATSNLCKGDRLNSAEVVKDCRAVALAFERGDTYITEMIGVAIAKRVWPEDSQEWKAAVEARRVYQYRSEWILKSTLSSLKDAQSAAEYLSLCGIYPREQDLWRAELIADGKSPDPPPDWTPSVRWP